MASFYNRFPASLLGLMLWGWAAQAYGQEPAGFAAREFRNAHGHRLQYRIFTPENYDPRVRYPLVLWLHDIVGVGNDNRKQIEGSNEAGAGLWVAPETQSKYPAFVLAPQCPYGWLWVNFLRRTPSKRLLVVLDLIDQLESEYSIDPERLYVAGQSMGGFATWALLAYRPDQFAAAVPVSGGGKTSKARLFAHVPVWAFHGWLDPLVPVHESRRMIAAMRRAGGEPRFSEVPLQWHGIRFWKVVFQEPGLADWLFAQRRAARSE